MRTGKVNEKGLSSRRRELRKRRADGGEERPGEGTSWRLPSGEGLMEFALHAGFLAPVLLDAHSVAKPPRSEKPKGAAPLAVESGSLVGGRR